MLQNAYFLAKIGADTAENEQHFAEILPKIGNYPMSAAEHVLDAKGDIVDPVIAEWATGGVFVTPPGSTIHH